MPKKMFHQLRRNEGPITYFQVPDGAKLGPAHSYLHARTEGTLGRKPSVIAEDRDCPQAKLPLETE